VYEINSEIFVSYLTCYLRRYLRLTSSGIYVNPSMSSTIHETLVWRINYCLLLQ